MIKFSKYHGCGNAFVITGDDDVIAYKDDMPALARRICNQSIGVGADGLIVLDRSPLRMSLWNADGSVATMCGNGIRCVAAYCYDEELVPASVPAYVVETLAGQIGVEITETAPFECRINIGATEFLPDQTIELLDGSSVAVNVVYNGTDHAVIFIEEDPWKLTTGGSFVTPEFVVSVGRQLDESPLFPGGVNVDFAHVLTESVVQMITYERGAGLTAACGTGACAVAAVGQKLSKLSSDVTLRLPYGELKVYLAEDGGAFLSGPAQKVMAGKYYG